MMTDDILPTKEQIPLINEPKPWYENLNRCHYTLYFQMISNVVVYLVRIFGRMGNV